MSKSINTLQIHSAEVPVIEFNSERVLPFKLIDQIHGRPDGTAKRNFNTNEKYLIENEDFFEVCRNEFRTDIWEGFGFHTKASNGFLVTLSGYLMVVKSFTDDLSWEIQRELVNHYFKPTTHPGKLSAKDTRIIRARISNLTLKLSSTIDACAFEVIMTEINELCSVIKYPVPDYKKLGKDYRQTVLPNLDILPNEAGAQS